MLNYKEHKLGTKNSEGVYECADSWRRAFWAERIVCIARSYTVSTFKGSHAVQFSTTHVWSSPEPCGGSLGHPAGR